MIRRLQVLLISLAIASCSSQSPQDSAEILWDEWGVPHIFAPDTAELGYAYGWAQASSHGNVILRLYGESRGRASEYWGEDNVALDKWIHTMGIPRRAEDHLGAQSLEMKTLLESFAAGINDYAAQHPDRIEASMMPVLPVTAADILAHTQRVIVFEFVTSPRVATGVQRQLGRKGSNAWAIAPQRSESGNALLLANPHLPWSGFFLFHEAHLVGPDIDIYGSTLMGTPIVAIGFNERLGWTHTVNTHDGQDLYALKLQDGGYVWNGETRPFETREQSIRIGLEDGTYREERFQIRESVHGPVIAQQGDQAVALRVVGKDAAGLPAQYWAMARAQNLTEFEAAISQLQMPMFTVMYADRDGRILSLFGGLTPVRPAGDWRWEGVVPGHSEETLWTETHAYGALPRVVDPPSGWAQNANDPPWTTTLPYAVEAANFPSYMAPRSMHFRAQRSARMLMEDDKITFRELVDYKFSTRMELADRVLGELIPALRRKGPAGEAVANVLEEWDRSADAESRGSVLFADFATRLLRGVGAAAWRTQWDESQPRVTPSGLADADAAASLMLEVADSTSAKYGAADVQWGDVYRFKRGSLDLPGNGAPGAFGVFRVIFFEPAQSNQFRAAGGDSFIAAVEFSDPVKAEVLNSSGASEDPNSPHYADQLELSAQKKLRPALLTRAQIEEHLEKREVLTRPRQ